MVRILLYACTLMFFTLPLQAEHVYIWNFDDEDIFYCEEYGGIIDCSYWIEQTLAYHGHTFETDTLLPTDLSAYDVVFVTTGWFRC